MGNLLETGAVWLAEQLKSHASKSVQYQRGSQLVSVSAIIGTTDFEIDDGNGIVERFQSRDFLIHAADLVLDGAATLPIAGDRIGETKNGQTFVYEVMAPGSEPHFRFSDAFRKLLRIHTKHVATE